MMGMNRRSDGGRLPTNGANALLAVARGYTTESGRRDWCAAHGKYVVNQSLTADPDPAEPLYHWQLFSLLGRERITAIVGAFYKRIYADDEPGSLKGAFARIASLDHHIATQSAFWCDHFGGGQQYHGGDQRIDFHHHNNAGQVMNAAGAKRWMHHMALTLQQDVPWWRWKLDPRVKPCLVDFLRTRMMKYTPTILFSLIVSRRRGSLTTAATFAIGTPMRTPGDLTPATLTSARRPSCWRASCGA